MEYAFEFSCPQCFHGLSLPVNGTTSNHTNQPLFSLHAVSADHRTSQTPDIIAVFSSFILTLLICMVVHCDWTDLLLQCCPGKGCRWRIWSRSPCCGRGWLTAYWCPPGFLLIQGLHWVRQAVGVRGLWTKWHIGWPAEAACGEH